MSHRLVAGGELAGIGFSVAGFVAAGLSIGPEVGVSAVVEDFCGGLAVTVGAEGTLAVADEGVGAEGAIKREAASHHGTVKDELVGAGVAAAADRVGFGDADLKVAASVDGATTTGDDPGVNLGDVAGDVDVAINEDDDLGKLIDVVIVADGEGDVAGDIEIALAVVDAGAGAIGPTGATDGVAGVGGALILEISV